MLGSILESPYFGNLAKQAYLAPSPLLSADSDSMGRKPIT